MLYIVSIRAFDSANAPWTFLVFHANTHPHNTKITLKIIEIMLKALDFELHSVCSTYSPCDPIDVLIIGLFGSIIVQHNCIITSIITMPTMRSAISIGVILTFRIEGLLNMSDTRCTLTNKMENMNVKHTLNIHGRDLQFSSEFSPRKTSCTIGITTDANANKTRNSGCAAPYHCFLSHIHIARLRMGKQQRTISWQ